MPFFNPADYSSLVLIKAAKDHLIDRQTWYEGSLFSQLKQGGYGKYRVINITRIEERLSQFCSDPRVEGTNVEAQDELSDIRTKIEKMKQIEKELKDKENWDSIFNEYIQKLEADNSTPAEFFSETAKICMNHKRTMYKHYNKFKEFYAIKQEVYGDGAEDWNLKESLEHYIENNPTDKNGVECLQIVDDALHDKVIRAVVNTFFKRKDTKKYCVWLNGLTSSGKSEFIKCYKQIFSCQKGDFHRGYLVT